MAVTKQNYEQKAEALEIVLSLVMDNQEQTLESYLTGVHFESLKKLAESKQKGSPDLQNILQSKITPTGKKHRLNTIFKTYPNLESAFFDSLVCFYLQTIRLFLEKTITEIRSTRQNFELADKLFLQLRQLNTLDNFSYLITLLLICRRILSQKSTVIYDFSKLSPEQTERLLQKVMIAGAQKLEDAHNRETDPAQKEAISRRLEQFYQQYQAATAA